jgi:hypothetical protein
VKAFEEYYEKMPWVAIPFNDIDAIKKKHGINSIPTVPLFQADSSKISDNIRTTVADCKEASARSKLISDWKEKMGEE